MTSIAEFILARVAEDEEGARIWPREWWSSRLEAECEVKRRMVEWAAPVLENWPNAPKGWRYISDDGMDALKILAAVWADHPDYREEWR